jgi:hypothetical protein
VGHGDGKRAIGKEYNKLLPLQNQCHVDNFYFKSQRKCDASVVGFALERKLLLGTLVQILAFGGKSHNQKPNQKHLQYGNIKYRFVRPKYLH